jgi:hypothetical protein
MSNFYTDSTNSNIVPIIRIGEVISIIDPTKSGTIKVRLQGIDANESDTQLIPCVPLLPKYLVTLPKVGESVFIFQYESNMSTPVASFKNKRFWIGPLITQPTKLDNEPYNSSLSILPDGYEQLRNPNLEIGSYGNDDDVILQGRYNTDIIQKDRQIWLRTGKTLDGEPNRFNDVDLGYIQLKYGNEKLKRNIVDREITELIPQFPDITINVIINTITNDGQILSGDLTNDRYTASDVNRTEVFITISDYKTGDLVNGFENETFSGGTNSRQEGTDAAKEFIDNNKGDRWLIKSNSNEIITGYKGENGIAVSDSIKEPIESTKTIKVIEFEKGEQPSSSVINVVANKINLISHDGEHTFELTNPESLISDEEQEKINNEAHPIVYGDKLVEFLELVKDYVKLHVHPYHGREADPSTVKTGVLNFDLNTILNPNINTN